MLHDDCGCSLLSIFFSYLFIFPLSWPPSTRRFIHLNRAFYVKLELITRIYYDVVRFVHICTDNHGSCCCCFVSFYVDANMEGIVHPECYFIYVCHSRAFTDTVCFWLFSPYFRYLYSVRRSIIVFFSFSEWTNMPFEWNNVDARRVHITI